MNVSNNSKNPKVRTYMAKYVVLLSNSVAYAPRWSNKRHHHHHHYPTLLPRVQISRETSTNNRYLYSSHSSRPREVKNLGKSEFWEKKSLDNKSLIRRFGM